MKYLVACLVLLSCLSLNRFVYAAQINMDEYEIVEDNKPFYTDEYPADKYLFVSYDADDNKYIEKKSIRVSIENGQKIVDFWMVSVFKIGGLLNTLTYLEESGVNPDEAKLVTHQKTHLAITENGHMSFIGTYYCTAKEDIVLSDSDEINLQWIEIEPGSNAELIYNTVLEYLEFRDSV